MRRATLLSAAVLAVAAVCSAGAADERVIFEDGFEGGPGEGWSWVREDAAAWRARGGGLEVRIQPGSEWGPANDARNILVRAAPQGEGAVAAAVTVFNQPAGQYEQAGIAWYYDDSHMVKLVKEYVDGRVWVVMGREEADRAVLAGREPLANVEVRLRLVVRGDRAVGQFRTADTEGWREVGGCSLPAKGEAKISLQAYQGPADAARWARFTNFRVVGLDE